MSEAGCKLHDDLLGKKRPEPRPTGEEPRWVVECRAWRRWESDPGEVPVLGQRSELVAKITEAVALLTQYTPIHGGIELDDIAQRPERAEQGRVAVVVRMGRSIGSRNSRFAAERRGIDQRVARDACLLPAGRLGGGGRRRSGGVRFLVDRIEFLRTQASGVVAAQGV